MSVTVVQAGKRQSFTLEEKKRIVSESYQSNQSLNKFAKRMGLSPATLCIWRKQFRKDCATEPQQSSNETAIVLQDNVNFPAIKSQFEAIQQENTLLKTENISLKSYVTKLESWVGRKTLEACA